MYKICNIQLLYFLVYLIHLFVINNNRCNEFFCVNNSRIYKGRKEMFYLTSTFDLQLYGERHMVKKYSDSKRGNLLLASHGLLFLISSKVSF